MMKLSFQWLVKTIRQAHSSLHESTIKAINQHLTVRNWLIGFYIVEFEQQGKNRAAYGTALLQKLAGSLNQESLSFRNLKLFRQFYFCYPEFSRTVSEILKNSGVDLSSIVSPSVPEGYLADIQTIKIGQTLSAQFDHSTLADQRDRIFSRLSFSHFALLIPIRDRNKRRFFELACMQGNWSIRELKRQINSLYYERSGMSRDPDRLGQMVHSKAEGMMLGDIIKSPFTFEFLGLASKEVVYENDLEKALVDHLQDFLLELGHGFCFEAKQKRIPIGNEYYYIDLVFYHRILKCHILVELKTKELKHEHIGQLKTYLNYYKKEVLLPGDNPPVGILLVTERNKALVEYAMADSDQSLFVSKYRLELPSKELLEKFITWPAPPSAPWSQRRP